MAAINLLLVAQKRLLFVVLQGRIGQGKDGKHARVRATHAPKAFVLNLDTGRVCGTLAAERDITIAKGITTTPSHLLEK